MIHFWKFAATLLVLVASMSNVQAQALVKVSAPLPAFSQLIFEIPADLEIVPAQTFSYSIEAEQKVVNVVKFVVARDTLKITAPAGYNTEKPLRIVVRVPVLTSLTNEGSGDIKLGAVQCKALTLKVLGSGSLTSAPLNCTEIAIENAGSGDVTVSGKTNRLNVNQTGAGSVDAQQCIAGSVSSMQSGSGDVSVHANVSLTASLNGAGDLKYRGAIKPSAKISGVGELIKLR
jgi:Putative auto-transporter adhesin, head GIN domain